MKIIMLALSLVISLFAVKSAPEGLTVQMQDIQTDKYPRNNANRLITAEELNALLQSPNPPILLDVSKKGYFLVAHIPNAKHFEIDPSSISSDGELRWSEKNGSMDEFKTKLGSNFLAPIIIYDEGHPTEGTSLAEIACMWAKKLGYKNLYHLSGGMKIWKENRFKTINEVPDCCH